MRGLFLGAVLLLSACGGPRTPTRVEQGIRDGVLHRGNGSEPESLDPHFATSVSAGNIVLALFEGLVRENPVTLAPEPGMAESWDRSGDGLTYTFHLRSARWSNGDPVSAQDFVFAYRRILSPTLGADYAYMLHVLDGAAAFHEGRESDPETLGVRALDEQTLELRLHTPVPYFLSLLNHWTWFPLHRASLIAQKADRSRESAWTRDPVVNGAFVLEQWKPGELVSLKRNPLYWDADQVRLQGARFYTIPDNNAEERAFRAGDLHITYKLPLHKLAAYQSENPDVLRVDPYLESVYYALNVRRAPLNDRRVRQALSLALQREVITGKVLKGTRAPALSFVPPGTAGFESPLHLHEDLEAARDLLREAGYPGGRGFPELELLFPSSKDNTVVAEVVQQQWLQNLGLRVRLVNAEKTSYLARRRAGEFDLCYMGWVGDYVDPTTFLDLWLTAAGNNLSGWSSAAFDAAMRAAQTAEGGERLRWFGEAEKELLTDLPLLPLYFGTTKYLVHPSVQNWHPTLLDHHPLRAVFLRSDGF